MKYTYQCLFVILLMGMLFSCNNKTTTISDESETMWPESNGETKPWTRWWWHGSSVTKKGITQELEAYAEAGIGGLELTPIYGVKGDETNFLTYLSPEWVDMLVYTLEEAERLGLGVDMATGTGWPFGGPWVDSDIACRYIAHKKYLLNEGQALNEKIEFIQKPILRTVNNPKLKFDQLVQPIADNADLQNLALDQIRFEQSLPIHSLVAYSKTGETINLTEKVKNGKLDWIAPKGEWTVYALFQGWHGKMVERAAPGGEGNVIDHFSTKAIEEYLAKFDESFAGKNTSALRAFFNDSYEVDDASGQADWTPQLFEAFKAKRGYDLKDHLPALFGEDRADKNTRVISDYRETISDLLYETFTQTWSKWAKKNQAVIRNQAHGSPANILDLYAASDIPETEGTDLIKAKMASSAAHVAQRPLISAEAATWLGEHFTTNLADLKRNVDRYFVAGVNHIFYHGTTYSPSGDEWPGRLFYAAIHANPRNSLWHDYPIFNKYIERTQSFLQSGQSDNDVLVYFPSYDRYAAPRNEMLEHFDGNATSKRDKEKSSVREVAEMLNQKGYAYDFISDTQLEDLQNEGKKIKCGQLNYKVIVVPSTDYMPLTTIKKLQALSDSGAAIVFQDRLPMSVPGYGNLEKRSQAYTQVINEMKLGQALVSEDLISALNELNIPREGMADQALEYSRRTIDGEKIYFVSNWSDTNFDGWVTLSVNNQSIAIFNPMTGEYGLADTREKDGYTSIKLQLNRGESLILKSLGSRSIANKWMYINSQNQPIALDGKWTVDFLQGGPVLPAKVEMEDVKLWTNIEGQDYNEFSGTGRYRVSFARPQQASDGWVLDLGQVEESASVTLNGTYVGTTIGPVHQLYFSNDKLNDQNVLEVKVSNSMANRIIAIEKSGKRWQKFHNINVSARLRENLGQDRVFTTKDWPIFDSGLAGPVTITATK